ncbi:hypothetical protein [Rhodococcus sp. ACPA1]|uniref:hypothetical protein n=1 Tax=Rhodococcus sp. ACPA1 TaxID=2028572 RepID=UPI000BB13DB0|nr:hypothetical protein [Rhodococcus sp. ACPA1]PBC47210.1 hypothetical protein CJ177_43655 [Rhodococcus sp. ACPA1]
MSPQQIPQQRRTLAVLVGARILSGAGPATGIAVGAMLERTSLAGLPGDVHPWWRPAAAQTANWKALHRAHLTSRATRR